MDEESNIVTWEIIAKVAALKPVFNMHMQLVQQGFDLSEMDDWYPSEIINYIDLRESTRMWDESDYDGLTLEFIQGWIRLYEGNLGVDITMSPSEIYRRSEKYDEQDLEETQEDL